MTSRYHSLSALEKPEEQQETAQGMRQRLWLSSFKKGLVLGWYGKLLFWHFGNRNWLRSNTGFANSLGSTGAQACTLTGWGAPCSSLYPHPKLCVSDPEGEAEGAPSAWPY